MVRFLVSTPERVSGRCGASLLIAVAFLTAGFAPCGSRLAFAQLRARPTADSLGDPLPTGARLRLGTTRFGPPSSVHGLALSPDGTSIVSYCGELIVWDTQTGKQRWRTQTGLNGVGTGYGIRTVAFSSDSSRFYTPGPNNEIHVWTTSSGQQETIALRPHLPWIRPETFRSIDITRDGRKIAVGNSNGLQVCDPLGKSLFRVSNSVPNPPGRDNDDRLMFTGAFSYGRFSPDGKVLAVVTNGRPKEIRFHDTDTGKELRTISLTSNLVRMDFSPDGTKIVATERDSAIRLYDTASGDCSWSHVIKLVNPFENYTSDVAFSPDGKVIAAGATDHRIYLIDPATGQEAGTLTGHHWYPWTLAFASDSKTIYSSGWDRPIRRWDVAERKQLPLPEGIRGSSVVTASPDGRWLAFADDDGAIRILDSNSGAEQRKLDLPGMDLTQLLFSPDGRHLASGGSTADDVQVVIWDVSDGRQLHLWNWPKGKDPHSDVESLSFAPDGNKLAAAIFRQDAAYIWDLSTGLQVAKLDHRRVYGLSFGANGKTLATAGWDSISRFWNTDAWDDPQEINLAEQEDRGGKDPRMYTVCCSPDGRLVATAHMDGTVRIWSSDRQLRCQFEVKGRFIHGAMNFSPDGLWLATGAASGSVELWDPLTAKKVRDVGSHQSYVYTVGFGRDSRTIVSGGADGLCYVWDMRPAERGGDDDLEKLWNDLAGDDSAVAYTAMCLLSEVADRSVALVAGKLRTVRSVIHPENLPVGEASEDSEHRIRMMKLLVKKEPKIQTAVTVRRAVSVLGQIVTPEAIRQLKDLAEQDPESEVAAFANSELKRLMAKEE